MEIGSRLKEYRNEAGMTQDAMADALYVTRQTVSNWENDKSYPDIHSLLMISELFHVSLDTLIKGDLETMKEKIDQSKIRSFKRDNNIFSILVIASLVSAVPLYRWFGPAGIALWAPLFAAAIYFSVRVEKVKREQDIHTYREILAFMKGEKLDAIEKAREEGKRSYQWIVMLLAGAVFGVVAAWLIDLIMGML